MPYTVDVRDNDTNERNGGNVIDITTLINRWLASHSPARQTAIRECNRRIGLARYHARQAMVRAALVEEASGVLEPVRFLKRGEGFYAGADTGPGFLPRIVWETLPYVALRRVL